MGESFPPFFLPSPSPFFFRDCEYFQVLLSAVLSKKKKENGSVSSTQNCTHNDTALWYFENIIAHTVHTRMFKGRSLKKCKTHTMASNI